jgi:hypothetical protein
MSSDCYFFIDANVPEEERKILCLHVKCRDENCPDMGWFYEGSKEGYGPWDFICHFCGGFIHKAESNDEESVSESSD